MDNRLISCRINGLRLPEPLGQAGYVYVDTGGQVFFPPAESGKLAELFVYVPHATPSRTTGCSPGCPQVNRPFVHRPRMVRDHRQGCCRWMPLPCSCT
ncbi:hypothetical protein Rmet_6595 [Cupriavidus metallidurans CH34]|uniref:Uncharacterized protein n=1 Tax=Cupriavidus metallidurans (strain ATCC 43123 / DSM 2839 / NBRC 102507 / CH34) TaxID=266264 RepID=D3DY26_CUPMC|nr:hypothetical protein Rmet_6595 [Cupriavidus metallidurans CH34]